jgi:MFS transporter, ACS family, tartrate transporter
LSNANFSPELETQTYHKVARHLIPLLFLCYVVAFLDRVNVGFAKLQMAPDLQFSDAVFGFGAGIFFVGYFIFEVPSNVILERVGARIWIARIMITWGIISSAMMITNDETSFYLLRFLLGVAEAGFFPGIILYLTYWFPASRRARMVALFMTAIAISNVVGSPISGAIMQLMDGVNDWRGWQWLFLLEGIPSVLAGLLVLGLLPDGPRAAKWLTRAERELIEVRLREEHLAKERLAQRHSFVDAFRDARVWALAAVYFCGVVCFYAVGFWMPTIIQELEVGKTDYLQIGLLSGIPWGSAAIAMVYWGHHSDRSGERRWHSTAGLALVIAGTVVLAIVGKDPIPAMTGLCLVAVGLLSWLVTFWSLPTAFLSGTAAAAGIAWINSVGNLGGYFGPDLVGRIRMAMNGADEAAFYALAAVAFLGAIITVVLPRTQHRAATVLASRK